MSCMHMLYQTYQNNIGLAGSAKEEITLSVVAHIVANAQLEIHINAEGDFLDANEIGKKDAKTLIPVTEQSAGRSSGLAPHALCDTLSYVAGDLLNYAEEKNKKKLEEKFNKYEEALRKWKESVYSHPKVEAVYKYISRKSMISDLIKKGMIVYDEGEFLEGKINGKIYEKSLVRFKISGEENVESIATWLDKTLIEQYTNYYLNTIKGIYDICYLSGEKEVISTNHPKGIIAANYGAKLISANDAKGFTYRGRFETPGQACVVSYESTQKVHNALTWLAAKQGMTIGSKDKRTYVIWNPKGKKVPGFAGIMSGFQEEEQEVANTQAEFCKKLYKFIMNQSKDIEKADDIVIIGLDAATTGRLSITYYNELKASDFLERIQDWGENCSWYHLEFKNDEKPKVVVKSPHIKDIIRFAFGTQQDKKIELNDKYMKQQFQRILHCVLEQQPIPKDIVHALVIKASTPLAYSKGNRERILSTTCAVLKKQKSEFTEGGKKDMQLDLQNKERSYLFGRLLGVLEQVERRTYSGEEKRDPNAIRLQAAYVNHPMQTWHTVESLLIPYYSKLSEKDRQYFKNIISDIVALFKEEDLNSQRMNKALEHEYLLGYYLQRRELKSSKSQNEAIIENEN